jgi:TolB-like protein
MSFFREMRRRNVYRVGAAYVIVGWLIIQIAVNIFPNLQLPPWTVTLVTVLVTLGFPVALLLAWAFELTPDGVRLSRSGDSEAPITSRKSLDYALLAGLILVAGMLVVSSFRGIPGEVSIGGETDTVFIAIRPFQDNSPDGDYAWLGQGFASELRNALGRIDGIEVAPPSFEFSFDNSDAVAIVDFAVEGDIRVDGETLRISSSLTNVGERSSRPLLQENYQLSSAFTIQEDLAARILALLGVRLGVQDVNAFAGAGTTDMDAYENYLRAISAFGPTAFGFLQEAVRIDPDYANAWAQLGLVTTARKWLAEQPSQMLPFTREGLRYAQRAHELQPESAEVLAMLGTMYYGTNDWSQGHAYHLSALSMRRTPIALNQSAMLLHRAGKSSDALARVDEADEVSTLQFVGVSPFQRAVMLMQLRRYDDARKLFSEMSPTEHLDAELMLNLSAGTTEDVRQSIAMMASGSEEGSQNAGAGSRLYTPLLAVFDQRNAAPSLLREIHEDENSWPSKWHDIGRLAAWFGDAQFAFELVAEEARNGSPRRSGLWMPTCKTSVPCRPSRRWSRRSVWSNSGIGTAGATSARAMLPSFPATTEVPWGA